MGNGSPRLQRTFLTVVPLFAAASLIGAPSAYADAIGLPASAIPTVPVTAPQPEPVVQAATAAVAAATTTAAPAPPTPPAPLAPAPPLPAVPTPVPTVAAPTDTVVRAPVPPVAPLTPARKLPAAGGAASLSHRIPARPDSAALRHGVVAGHRGRPSPGRAGTTPEPRSHHATPVAAHLRPGTTAGTPVPKPPAQDRSPGGGGPGGAAGGASPGFVLLVFAALAATLAWALDGRGRRISQLLQAPHSAALVLELERPD